MTKVCRLLPRLTVNRRLLQVVVDERQPCCALSLVEERKQQIPVIILGLPEIEDPGQLGDGFRLGHQVAFARGGQALRLDFAFPGMAPLQVVLDPANEIVRRVLAALIEADAYFVLVVGARGLTAFRADTQREERQRFNDILRQTAESPVRSQAVAALEHALHAQVAGATPLVWLGRGDRSLLELSGAHGYELRPAP